MLLSGQPSRHYLLLLPDLSSKVALVQQQLRLTDAEVGQLMAAGLVLTGTEATLAAAMQWLVSYAGSQEAAASMLRFAPTLLSYSAGTLDSKVAALQAAWAGKLQPGQVQRLVNKSPLVLEHSKRVFGPAADVLCSWFPQPGELLAVVAKAPALLFTPAACLQANERWMTGPPLSLSRRHFLALVQAAPQPFSMKLAAPLTQHKLAFLTQVCWLAMLGHKPAYSGSLACSCRGVALLLSSIKVIAMAKGPICHKVPLSACRLLACAWSVPSQPASSTI